MRLGLMSSRNFVIEGGIPRRFTDPEREAGLQTD